MSNLTRSEQSYSQDQACHEQLEICLKNLFEVPSKNIELAFELILGLIKKQSAEISRLKQASAEALDSENRTRVLMQNAVDELVKEKAELSIDLQKLKKQHEHLLESCDKTASTVDVLKHEVETLTFNLLGDCSSHESRSERELDSTDAEHDIERSQTQNDSNVNAKISLEGQEIEIYDNTECDEDQNGKLIKQALAWGTVGRIALTKIEVAKVKLNADRTVVARLDRIERCLSSLVETWVNYQSTHSKPAIEEMSRRIFAVETFLDGFEQINVSEINIRAEPQPKANDLNFESGSIGDGKDSSYQMSSPTKTMLERGEGADQNNAAGESHIKEDGAYQNKSANTSHSISKKPTEHRSYSSQMGPRGSLLFHLNERENRTGLSIDDLAQQISALREYIKEQKISPIKHGIHPEEIQNLLTELQKQLAELVITIDNKVSNEDFETKIQEMRCILNDLNNNICPAESDNESATSNNIIPDGLATAKKHILEQKCKLEAARIDKDAFKLQLEQLDRDLKSLINQEILKQQLTISTNNEKTENDLIEIKSIIDAHNDTIMRLHNESLMSSDVEASVKGDDVNARIQQATDALRESLEERLDELRTIECEMDGLASKLAEKPSQDQIDSMIRDLEKRLGQDETLQMILTDMKIELKQRMTKGEVMTLVKNTFREAKLGVQNTKDTLMIGRIPYCLGCSQPFPAGVNGIRAPKMNHDSLPPASGLVSNATLYGTGSRRSLRVLRSIPQRPRPKSAIVGKFAPASAYVRVRNNSR